MGIPAFLQIIVVTRKTPFEDLVERYNTEDQAEFYLEHMGVSFKEYRDAHEQYQKSLMRLKESLPPRVRVQFVDRSFLPTFQFGPRDLVVTLGPDGLVINTAKYLHEQPLVAFNPDASRIDGVLIPFGIDRAKEVLDAVLSWSFQARYITMAKARLNDGQVLYAVNDLFIGQRTHCSARYRLTLAGRREHQSSSGIIVSTGAGSTGWLRSILTGAAGVVETMAPSPEVLAIKQRYAFDAESDELCFHVREPFVSRTSNADLVFGRIRAGEHLEVVSEMPQNGVIFSDGIESDFLKFDSGTIARIEVAEKKVHLVSSR